MARKVDTSAYATFGDITQRLNEIVDTVRKRDLPLESSLDLFDEAVALGSKAVDFVDTSPVTTQEKTAADAATEDASGPATHGGAPADTDTGDDERPA